VAAAIQRLYPDGLEPKAVPGNGAVAQLGERELCKLEVIGSIPFSSTTWLCLVSETNLAKPVSAEALAKADWRCLAATPIHRSIGKLEARECKHSLSSAFQAEKLDIVKEDLCGHVMLHVEGRVPLVGPDYWVRPWNDGFVWCVMAFGRYCHVGDADPESDWLM
jgi:hypothetical protein